MRSLIPNQGVQSIHLKRETENFVSNSCAVSLSGEAKRPSFLELHCFREICFSIKLSTTFLAQARALPMTGDKNRFFSVRRPSLAPRRGATEACRAGFWLARSAFPAMADCRLPSRVLYGESSRGWAAAASFSRPWPFFQSLVVHYQGEFMPSILFRPFACSQFF